MLKSVENSGSSVLPVTSLLGDSSKTVDNSSSGFIFTLYLHQHSFWRLCSRWFTCYCQVRKTIFNLFFSYQILVILNLHTNLNEIFFVFWSKKMEFVFNLVCQSFYNQKKITIKFTNNHICAISRKKDSTTCQGDNGGSKIS